MPKVVDHSGRRQELIEAALRVLTAEGLDATSVRRVAEESGYSPGALRYYFPRQQALHEAVIDKVTTTAATRLIPRIRALQEAGPGEVIDASCALLAELMPLDVQRKSEWAIWTALLERPAGSANVARWRTAGWAGTRHHCRHVLQRLAQPTAPQVPPGPAYQPSTEEILEQVQAMTPLADPVAEARAAALHAVVDGLSVQTSSFPDQLPPPQVAVVLRQVVTDLAKALS